jgi:hypothetical protein
LSIFFIASFAWFAAVDTKWRASEWKETGQHSIMKA